MPKRKREKLVRNTRIYGSDRLRTSCKCGQCMEVSIGRDGLTMVCPSWMAAVGWRIHTKGYAYYTSSKRRTAENRLVCYKRGTFAQRVVTDAMIVSNCRWFVSTHIPIEYQAHHMDNDKLNNCPLNLLILSPLFNPSGAIRDPYTGRYLTKDEYLRRYM